MDLFSKEMWVYITSFGESWKGLFIAVFIAVLTLIAKNFKVVATMLNSIFSRKKKMSHGEIALNIINMVSEALKNKREVIDYILDHQMNYVEMKSEALYTEFLINYKEDQVEFRHKNSITDYVMERKEYFLYQEGLSNAFRLIGKELRRSFKENGFYDKSGKEFQDYVKEKSKELISMGKKYLMLCYPSEDMIVPLNYIFQKLDHAMIEDIAFDIYINAKDIKIKAIDKIKTIDEEFKNNINRFVY